MSVRLPPAAGAAAYAWYTSQSSPAASVTTALWPGAANAPPGPADRTTELFEPLAAPIFTKGPRAPAALRATDTAYRAVAPQHLSPE